MKVRKVGNVSILEFDTREEALKYAIASQLDKDFWLMVVEAELKGLISQN